MKMTDVEFYNYLKKTGRKPHVIERYQRFLSDFEDFLQIEKTIQSAKDADINDLRDFAEFFEQKEKRSSRTALYALMHYYKATSNKRMAMYAQELREPKKAKKLPFSLKQMLGVEPQYVKKLANIGIKTANQMIEAGTTQSQRETLAQNTNIPYEVILELVKLSDLSRIGYVRTKFTRLFYNAGIQTPVELSKWDIKELRSHLKEYIEKSGWEGIVPFPSDLSNYINDARSLPQVIDYE
jgi:hypothetical protein